MKLNQFSSTVCTISTASLKMKSVAHAIGDVCCCSANVNAANHQLNTRMPMPKFQQLSTRYRILSIVGNFA